MTDNVENQLKSLIVESLNLEGVQPEDIEDEAPLFSEEGLGLDSIDALELGMAIKKKFGVAIGGETEENRSRFRSVSTLADYIRSQQSLKR
ncbi:phosphopantetheine-binding protein [Mesosutterella sp. OilRF-GAM-744-9]|uniref:Phosphopantetheine-binding protein n=1 Tax=Mesosutterella porci TaxID=2915351 RepID=A0ABS9MQX3_9BURK|nr:phosphopantetheine-binding protein [Mesosutterella sp. oilRF-744-WT-GAM-9]MCG5031021.1 phosphopantetheine-binding protein [Mesosutterella sp. oilRF-744-WT-GAM-9]MCI6529691.1 phosphopantetheine-binding protein [Mesosutterella sp.]